MFQFQPFTDAEIAADRRLFHPLADKALLIRALQSIAENSPADGSGRDHARDTLHFQEGYERRHEHEHLDAMQADNVRRGWKPATLREILGEPQYVPTHDTTLGDPQED